ncbi:flagellar basal body-associated protein FliL [Psychrobium sp. 1_MG-2023]|uniref:flagellar basal body-associated protein FliL n=1 Tax=Psychrobium sp. 1_MG-2023 TaxID=3062624 RepID=UPI000C338C71|nr:flagellar basal body-associated protein FliL [Psychrobium sp. 1_MG-2023]MDP2559832.1 flagellar basal body-associated protein FliL [Psychrobium sp. 1_MG-2023]PKF59064.1 flagellar basal body-associated protein FliL [Alteromonadales bacterium alter-6D02]
MADDAVENEEAQGGGKKKMIIIIAAVLIILIGGGAGAYFFLMGGDEPTTEMVDGETLPGEEVEPEEQEAEEATVGDAFYVGMPRPFVFNVPGYGRDRLVQIKVQLLVRGGENDTAARKHIPLIEDTLLTVFSSSNAEKLSTNIGKQELRQNALEAVQKALEPIVGNSVVEQVLFIGFVMQ